LIKRTIPVTTSAALMINCRRASLSHHPAGQLIKKTSGTFADTILQWGPHSR
jgi:hypothetical protein